MDLFKRFLLFSTITACIFYEASAITCFSCSTAKDCNDDFVSNSADVSTLDSSVNCRYCTKTKYIDHGEGTHYVSRGCITDDNSYKSVKDMGCYSCDSQPQGQSCKSETITCYCDTNDCNHGNKNTPLLGFFLIMSFLIMAIL